MKKQIVRILLLVLLAVLPTVSQATRDNDFVARLMGTVEAQSNLYPATDYQQITVSPTMIQSVMEMMANGSLNNTDISHQNQEIITKLLRNIKSLRLFIATNNADNYQQLALRVYNDNKHTYKTFKSNQTKGKSSSTRIYTRKSQKKVVEIVVVEEPTQTQDILQILNMTGEFTSDFINLLLQMRN